MQEPVKIRPDPSSLSSKRSPKQQRNPAAADNFKLYKLGLASLYLPGECLLFQGTIVFTEAERKCETSTSMLLIRNLQNFSQSTWLMGIASQLRGADLETRAV